jgi:hypothetical protein
MLAEASSGSPICSNTSTQPFEYYTVNIHCQLCTNVVSCPMFAPRQALRSFFDSVFSAPSVISALNLFSQKASPSASFRDKHPKLSPSLLHSLLHTPKAEPPCFHTVAHSFTKKTGVGCASPRTCPGKGSFAALKKSRAFAVRKSAQNSRVCTTLLESHRFATSRTNSHGITSLQKTWGWGAPCRERVPARAASRQ